MCIRDRLHGLACGARRRARGQVARPLRRRRNRTRRAPEGGRSEPERGSVAEPTRCARQALTCPGLLCLCRSRRARRPRDR
eukprot:2253647-Prymnesium_polylepis.1